jgi:hypothetical protein
VTALIEIKGSLYRRPAWIPDSTVVVDIEITSAHIERYVVVAVTSDASEAGILIEAVAACCIGNK